MYMYLKSTDCLNVFPNNQPAHFSVKLPGEINYGLYKSCALIQMALPEIKNSLNSDILVICNFVVESYFGSTKYPIIQRYLPDDIGSIKINNNIANYVHLKNCVSDLIEISIIDGKTFSPVKFISGVSYFAFHFLEVEH